MEAHDNFMPTISQSNSLTAARYNFTPIQKNCVTAIISEVRRIYIDGDLRPGESVQRNLFENLEITFKNSQLSKLADSPKDAYKALKDLVLRPIEIFEEEGNFEKGWEIMTWLSYAKYNPKTKTYSVEVQKQLLPYIVELAREFTSYSLAVTISLKSFYSQRFYEFCCQYRSKGRFFLNVDELRFMLKLDNRETYNNFAELKRRVIQTAQRELKDLYDKNQCDLWFEYDVKDKEGKKVLSLWFTIHDRETELKRQLDYTQLFTEIRGILQAFFRKDKKFIDRSLLALKLNPDNAKKFLERAYEVQNEYTAKEVAPVLRFILKQDYGVK